MSKPQMSCWLASLQL